MSQTVTLTLPDNFFQPVQRAAQATKQPVEQLLLAALQASLPPLDGLPPEVERQLTALESLDDDALAQAMLATVPPVQQERLHTMLQRNAAAALSHEEHQELCQLQAAADLVMLRKARAAVLLRFRGKRVPTLAELSQMTETHQ